MSLLPTRRLALLFALAAPFWLWSAGDYGVVPGIVALSVVLALAILDASFSLRPSSIEVERQVADRLPFGETTEGSWRLTSRAARSLKVELFDRWPATMVRVNAEGTPWPTVAPRKAPRPDVVANLGPAGEVDL